MTGLGLVLTTLGLLQSERGLTFRKFAISGSIANFTGRMYLLMMALTGLGLGYGCIIMDYPI